MARVTGEAILRVKGHSSGAVQTKRNSKDPNRVLTLHYSFFNSVGFCSVSIELQPLMLP